MMRLLLAPWLGSLALLGATGVQAYANAQHDVLFPPLVCSNEDGQFIRLADNTLICREQVQVIEIFVDNAKGPSSHKSQCEICAGRLPDDCNSCVTIVGPCSTPALSPVTETIVNGGATTVLILTPTTSPLSTLTLPYTGTGSLSAPTTITTEINGSQVVVVETPTGTGQVLPNAVSDTQTQSGTASALPVATTSVSASETKVSTSAGNDSGSVLPIAGSTTTASTSTTSSADPASSSLSNSGVSSTEVSSTAASSSIASSSSSTTVSSSTSTSSTSSTSSSSSSSSSTTPAAVATFACDADAYIMQTNELYAMNLLTGATVEDVGTGAIGPGGNINALGYNPLDNYLYGFVDIGGGTSQLIRIDADGNSELLSLTSQTAWVAGDFDEDGQLWVATIDVGEWGQVDLNPSSATFGTMAGQGAVFKALEAVITDWAYVQSTGQFWTLMNRDNNGIIEINLVSFDRVQKRWAVPQNYGSVASGTPEWGPAYTNGDQMWITNMATKDVWVVPVTTPTFPPSVVSQTLVGGPNSNGARCLNAPVLTAPIT